LNNKSAFDNITHNKFLHNIEKKRVFELLLEFVKDILKNKYIIITIDNYIITKYIINIDILQNFSLSSIFYLFNNIDLLKTYNNIKLQISSTRFVNNINILIYNKSTKRSCKVLNKIYNKYK